MMDEIDEEARKAGETYGNHRISSHEGRRNS